MLRLRVVQAEFGDCLILEYGTLARPKYILIDGGPTGTYKKHLRFELERIRQKGGCLDLAILSHVDNDHVIGLLEMMADIADARSAGKTEIIPIQALWHNAFQQTVGGDGEIAGRLDFSLSSALPALSFMGSAPAVAFGISEGHRLLLAGQELSIPLNPGFAEAIITTQAVSNPVLLKPLKLWVVGPSPDNLQRLKKEWLEWLEKFESRVHFADEVEAEKIDRSVPNLSSIMLLAVSGRRKILLTGDGRGDELVTGLEQAGLLGASGKLHVDVLKLPHHGSARNINRAFFDTVTANTYILSANGRYNNPDLAALIWLVEAVRKQKRRVRIVATNDTDASRLLVREYPPEEYGYRLDVLQPGEHSIVI